MYSCKVPKQGSVYLSMVDDCCHDSLRYSAVTFHKCLGKEVKLCEDSDPLYAYSFGFFKKIYLRTYTSDKQWCLCNVISQKMTYNNHL